MKIYWQRCSIRIVFTLCTSFVAFYVRTCNPPENRSVSLIECELLVVGVNVILMIERGLVFLVFAFF